MRIDLRSKLDKLRAMAGRFYRRIAAVSYLGVPEEGIFYMEGKELGPGHFADKTARQAGGGPFEWPNMVCLNQAIACFIGDAKKIVDIGCGVGTFEWFAAVDPDLRFVACDYDPEALSWCRKNRYKDNIVYASDSPKALLNKFGKFDLAIAVDVIEHIADYGGFLREFVSLSDRAIITTPNRDRDRDSALRTTPAYPQHVREFDAGELYWLLKAFYKKVDLYSMPDQHLPSTAKIGLLSTMTPLIAVCSQ